ncbi:hypothetical protein NIG5292_02341 [Nereida ignava]|uniref:Uncharacterized protein n=1 Tax=Nereida ignava TaxID=282199 RepID=A0A0U1NNG6_9RHOB|nr:hypothetical protein NIG5292_02341 [Nereida ignava]SFJ81789.1 hypothetical protein SAMN02745667_02469 [Nereida ignava DSM 16309]
MILDSRSSRRTRSRLPPISVSIQVIYNDMLVLEKLRAAYKAAQL